MKNSITIHILLALALSATLLLSSCDKLKGEGDSLLYTPAVDSFVNIDIDLPCDINISYNNSFGFTIEAQQNIHDNLHIYVEDNTLYIELAQPLYDHSPIILNCKMPKFRNIYIGGQSKLEITSIFDTPSNIRFDVTGASHIKFTEAISCNDFVFNTTGTSILDMTSLSCARKLELTCDADGTSYLNFSDSVTCSNFVFKSSGSSTLNMAYLSGPKNSDSEYDGKLDLQCDGKAVLRMKGQMENSFLKVDGSIAFYGYDFKTKNTTIAITGNANLLQVQVEDQLDVTISGSATINYKGNPTTINITDSIGSLDLQKID
jgi:hypothetical protein